MNKTIIINKGLMATLLTLFFCTNVTLGIDTNTEFILSQPPLTNQPDENWNVHYIGSCPTTYPYANTVIVKDNHAYVTSHTERQPLCPPYHGALDIININTNPPYIEGSVAGDYDVYEPLDLAIYEEYAYVSDYKECEWGYPPETGTYLDEIDIASPHHPSFTTRTLVDTSMNHNVALATQQGYLYALRSGYLDIFSIPDIFTPLVSLPVPFVYTFDLTVKNDYAYLLGEIWQSHPPRWIPTLGIVNIRDPFSPFIVSETPCASSHCLSVVDPPAVDVVNGNRFVYLTTNYGLQIFDVSDPEHPSGGIDYVMPNPSLFVTTMGRYAYVSSGIRGVTVLDISFPEYPVPTGHYTTGINASALYVCGTTIYAVDDTSGLIILRFTSGTLQPPKRPNGPTEGLPGEEYTYTTTVPFLLALTPDADFYLLWSWGDNIDSGWFGPYHSGDIVNAQHIWTEAGEYAVRVKVKNNNNVESPWSIPLFVTIG